MLSIQATNPSIASEATVVNPPSAIDPVQSSAPQAATAKAVKTPVKKVSPRVAKVVSGTAIKTAVKTKPVVVQAPEVKKVSKPVAKAVKVPVVKVPVAKVATEKLIKAKSLKLTRDSFTMPKGEYLVIDQLKLRGGKLSHPVKKSELIRAGIKALSAMSDANFLTAVAAVPAIKTGRPSKK